MVKCHPILRLPLLVICFNRSVANTLMFAFFPRNISKIPSNTDSIHVIASSKESLLLVSVVFHLLDLLPAFWCCHYYFRINCNTFVCNIFNFPLFNLKNVIEYSLNICILFTFHSYTWFSCKRKLIRCDHKSEKIVQVALDRNVLLVRTLFRWWVFNIDWFPLPPRWYHGQAKW